MQNNTVDPTLRSFQNVRNIVIRTSYYMN